jgi:alpha-1,2-mannosyltransferase
MNRLEQFFTAERIRICALVLAGANLVAAAAWVLSLHGLMDVFHQPLGGDFVIFYGASDLTLGGHATAAYDAARLLGAERAAVPGAPPGLLWCYPPTFQLIIAPLAALPFAVAYGAWLAVSFALYFALIRRITDHRQALLLAVAFPGFFVAALQGQNGFLTTAALGFGLLLLDRRPWMAGVILGLLVYKPQFGVLLPLLLAGTGRWKSFAGAALSATGFIGLATAVFGVEAWQAFFRGLPDVSASLRDGLIPWSKIPSWYVALAWLGTPRWLAYAIHGLIAAAVAWSTLVAWRRPGPLALKAGLAVLATLIVTPYAFNYDLVMLAVPIAAVAEHARRHRLPTGALSAMICLFLTPNLFLGLAKATHVQLMPAAILIGFVAMLRVMRRADEAPAPSAAFGLEPA